MRCTSSPVLAVVLIVVCASSLMGETGQWQIVGSIYGFSGRSFVDPTGITFDGANVWAIEQHAPTAGTPLYRINPSTLTVEAEFLLNVSSNSVQGLSWDGRYIWISGDGFRVYRFDPLTDDLHQFCTRPSNPQAIGMACIGDSLFCTGWYGDVEHDDILMLDRSDCSYHVIADLAAIAAYGLAWDGARFLVCGRTAEQGTTERTLFRYDMSGNLLDTFEPFDFHAYDLAWDGEYLWVCDYGGQFAADGRICKMRLAESPMLPFTLTIYEQTGSINSYSFNWDDGRLYSEIAGEPGPQSHGYGGYDFGTSGCEYYDVYFSDALGNLAAIQPGDSLPDSMYLTIECMDLSCNTWLPDGSPTWNGAGNNLDAVVLEYPSFDYWGVEIVRALYGLCDEPFGEKTSNFAESALGLPDGDITKMGGGMSVITMRLGPPQPVPPDTTLQHDPMTANVHPFFQWIEKDVTWHAEDDGYISASYNSTWNAGVISLRDFDSSENPHSIYRIYVHADSSNHMLGYTNTIPDESDFHYGNIDLGMYIHSTGTIRPTWDVHNTGYWAWTLAAGYYDVMISLDGSSGTVSFAVYAVPYATAPPSYASPPIWSTVESRPVAGRYNIQINTYNTRSHVYDVWSSGGPPIADVNPLILSIADVENDEGRQVRIRWSASYYDSLGSPRPITSYAVWRRIDELPLAMQGGSNVGAGPGIEVDSPSGSAMEAGVEYAADDPHGTPLAYPPGDWDYVTSVPACCEDTYSTIVPTLADSTIASGMYYSVFYVRALTAVPGIYYDSPVDSGYSVDNLAPEPPVGIAGVQDASGLRITWQPCTAEDFCHYELYRGTTEEFIGGEMLAVLTECEFVDFDWTPDNNIYYYKIYSVDISGNASGYSLLSPRDNVATLLRSFAASFSGAAIAITWQLAEIDEGVDFVVMRAERQRGDFDELVGAAIERNELAFTFVDEEIEPGNEYRYRVECIHGSSRIALFETEPITTPMLPLTLYQNHPNPFNPATTIRFFLPARSHVSLEIYDVLGRLVVRLKDGELPKGFAAVEWDGKDANGRQVGSGIYFCRLRAAKEVISRKMVLIR